MATYEKTIIESVAFDETLVKVPDTIRATLNYKNLIYVGDGSQSLRVTSTFVQAAFTSDNSQSARVTTNDVQIIFTSDNSQSARVTNNYISILYTPIKVRNSAAFDDTVNENLITHPIELTDSVDFKSFFNKKGIWSGEIEFDDIVAVQGGTPTAQTDTIEFTNTLEIELITPVTKDSVKFSSIISSTHPNINVTLQDDIEFTELLVEPGRAFAYDTISFNDVPEIWQSGSDDDTDGSQVGFNDVVEADLLFWDYGSKSRIYSDSLKQYPDNYWVGDKTDLIFDKSALEQAWLDSYERIYPSRPSPPDAYEYNDLLIIGSSSEGWIELAEELSHYIFPFTTFNIHKDNISFKSFQWTKKSTADIPNNVKVEYLDRDEDYKINTAELANEADPDYQNELIREQKYQIHGVKKFTVAHRLAMVLLNEDNFTGWSISFETDIVAFKFCMGDIIGITRDDLDWTAKLFRIMSIEEMQDHKTKITAREFNANVYNPNYPGVTNQRFSKPTVLGNPYRPPERLEDVNLFEPIDKDYIYVMIRPSKYNPELTFGVSVDYGITEKLQYYPTINEWVNAGGLLPLTPSVKFISDNSDSISFDPSTIIGTFPDEGVLIIMDEMIRYGKIDRINGLFYNLERGYKDTHQYYFRIKPVHSLFIYLFDSSLWYYKYQDSDIEQVFWVKARAVSRQGVINSKHSPVQTWMKIAGLFKKPLPVLRSIKEKIIKGPEIT